VSTSAVTSSGALAPPAGAYPPLATDRPHHELEQALLETWEGERLFERAQAARAGGPPFVFYEGPPTANGRPGIHHVFARAVKDLVCRHRAMRGHDVPRKAGWDTHGLPVEIEIEKRLDISGKQDIERVGVAEFNRLCRESVFTYREEWERLSARMGYWLDYARPYVTFSNDYVESVWWALKTLHERGLLYQGHKILPYCPRCETALSRHEVAQGYQDVEDPSVYVALDRRPRRAGAAPDHRVDDDAVDARLQHGARRQPRAHLRRAAQAQRRRLDHRPRRGARRRRARRRLGRPVGGGRHDAWRRARRAALPPSARLGALPDEGAREVIVGESFVSADDGSGVVHMAPAFGADDYAAGQRHGLAFVQPVNARGASTRRLRWWAACSSSGRRGDRRRAEAARRAVEGEPLRPQLPALLALRHAAALLRALVVVRAHHRVQATRCSAQRARRLEPAGGGSGALRRVAREQHRLGESRDRLLGHAAARVGQRRRPRRIEVIGSYAELARLSGRPLGADFDPHKPFIDAYTWPARAAPGRCGASPR
jgi:isoleucyl-tRNA synthetase